MPSRLKTLMLAETVERYREATSLVAISYTGVSAEEAGELRRKMREKQVRIQVVRNRVTRRAFEELGRSEFGRFLEGPVAVVSAGDPVEASKAAVDVVRWSAALAKKLEVKGGWTDGGPLTRDEVERMSTLPSRKVLLVQVAAAAAGALRSLVGMIDAPGASLARAVRAWNEKREKETTDEHG